MAMVRRANRDEGRPVRKARLASVRRAAIVIVVPAATAGTRRAGMRRDRQRRWLPQQMPTAHPQRHRPPASLSVAMAGHRGATATATIARLATANPTANGSSAIGMVPPGQAPLHQATANPPATGNSGIADPVAKATMDRDATVIGDRDAMETGARIATVADAGRSSSAPHLRARAKAPTPIVRSRR